MDIFNVLQIIIGFIGLILIAVPFSDNYKIINFKFIAYGILAQIVLAIRFAKNPFYYQYF
jgi:CNT family concentrative nucleoside transporter